MYQAQKWPFTGFINYARILQPFPEAGQMDVIKDLAYPLPTKVIAEMLGVPEEDHNQFRLWTSDLAMFLGNPPSISQSRKAQESIDALMKYFRNLVAQRRTHLKEDLLSSLIIAEEQGNVLSEEELFSNCIGLFIAGHETTTNLIGNGLLALLRAPEQLQKLKDEPALMHSAVEELLRYDSPIQYTARLIKKDIELGGKKIGAGQSVMLMIGATNRDPDQFTDPETLNITRNENHHLSFGHNIHFCIGAALARMEAQISLTALLEKAPELRLKSTRLEWQENLAFRGLKSLEISFHR
jgi:cytochrome P450